MDSLVFVCGAHKMKGLYPMTLDEYTEQMRRTIGPLSPNDHTGLILSALGLCGESGEFADLVKKNLFHGHDLNKEKLISELGDILWYTARAAYGLGVTLEDIARKNITKLYKRYPDGFSSERSINREG